jgi:hypothetical protein
MKSSIPSWLDRRFIFTLEEDSHLRAEKAIDYDSPGIHVPELLELYGKEHRLVSYLVSGLQSGTLNYDHLNETIHNLDTERLKILNSLVPSGDGINFKTLPTIVDPPKNLKITNNIVRTLQVHPPNKELKGQVLDLGRYLHSLLVAFDSDLDGPIVDLGKLLFHYDHLAQAMGLPPITHQGSSTLSRKGIVTLSSELPLDLQDEKNKIYLSMIENDFTDLDEKQLIDLLVYIDSLRDSSGQGSNKFTSLQNSIVTELAQRKRPTDHGSRKK